MKRRKPDPVNGIPAELVDPKLWPACPCWGGGEQPCSCWANQRQIEHERATGTELPFIGDTHAEFQCRKPFDRRKI